jgi:hypothetical protein
MEAPLTKEPRDNRFQFGQILLDYKTFELEIRISKFGAISKEEYQIIKTFPEITQHLIRSIRICLGFTRN